VRHTTSLFAATPFGALFVCVLVHVVVSRTAPGLPRAAVLAGSVLAGLGAVAAVSGVFLAGGDALASAAHAWGTPLAWALAYIALAYLYVFGFFNLGESARRVRLLIELDAAGARGLTLGDVLAAYNARMIVDARLGRLLAGGQIEERHGRYVIKRKTALLVARLLVVLKIIFLGSGSEFGAGRSAAAHPHSLSR
jgi:hypothetical protein